MNESCYTHEWVMSHMKESCHTHEWVMSHMNESCYTHEWVMSHLNESCYTHEWVMSHMNESCHTHEWVMSHMNESPPDPINPLCSLTGKSISEKHLTYLSVQTLKILFQGFCSPESDPPHKIMRYWFYYSTHLGFWISTRPRWYWGCISQQRHLGGAGPWIFLLIHRVGRCHT